MKTMESNNNSKGYTIVASCDPHNAKFHYHGQQVVEMNGATPVRWINDDEQRHMTREEAQDALNDLADYIFGQKDNLIYMNREDYESMVKELYEYGEEVKHPYEGDGWYDDRLDRNRLVYERDKDDSFRDDTMYYFIAEDDYPDESSSSWGGARTGAGRKTGVKKIYLSIRLPVELAQRLRDEAKARHLPVGEIVEDYIKRGEV